MKLTELKKGHIYSVSYDKALRLKYNGEYSIRNQMNSYDILASFTCVDKYSNGEAYSISFDTYESYKSIDEFMNLVENKDLQLILNGSKSVK